MITKQFKEILIDYCDDIIDDLHHMQTEVQNLQEAEEEQSKVILKTVYSDLDCLEKIVIIVQMRIRKTIEIEEDDK